MATLAIVPGLLAGGAAPTSRPAGLATTATTRAAKPVRRVCFVISTGGSMNSRMLEAIADVRAGVDALRADQTVQVFAVVNGTVTAALPVNRATPATGAAKTRVVDFLSGLTAVGQTSLAAGLKRALTTHPDVIWVVANGSGSDHDNAACLRVTRQLNAGGRVRIDTLLKYAGDDSSDPDGPAFLYQLAHANGGVCLDRNGMPLTAPPPPGNAHPPEHPRHDPDVPNVFKEN